MAIAVKPGAQTAADELRALLAQNEDRIVKLGDRQTAAEFYADMDRLADLWPAMSQTGADLRGEWTRWETLQATLQRQAARVLGAWGGASALVEARNAAAPGKSHWWWWLDELVAERRRSRTLKAMGLVVGVMVVAALVVFLFNRLFPVDEALQEAYRLRTDAETAILTGDYEAAFGAIRQAVQAMPEDATLQIMYGVLAEITGDSATAGEAWDAARALLQGKEAEFLMQRGMIYGQTNQLDKSAQDELSAIALDPNAARAYLYLGAAYEGQGKVAEALQAFTRASELAGDADPELVVLARTRMASLFQTGPLPTPVGASP